MVALWIRAGTAIAGDGALGVRLLAPVAAFLGSVLLAKAGRDLLGGQAGLIAAGLLNATLLFGVGSVTMTPDTPALLFWTATLWAMARLLATGRAAWWLVAGTAAGLAADSKYTAFLLLPAIGLWLCAGPQRAWLRRPQPWLGMAWALALFLPVAVWNARHAWVSFIKQGGRTDIWQAGRALQFEGELFLGQLGLATPIIAVLCGAGIFSALRRWRNPAWGLLAALTAVPGLVFLQHALGDRVQANWPAVIYPAAAIAAAGLGSRWVRPGMALGLGLTALVWVQGVAAPIPLPMRLDPTLLRLGGWDGLAAEVGRVADREQAGFVAADNYGLASVLARLVPAKIDILGAEARWNSFDLPRVSVAGRSGILLRSARREGGPDAEDWDGIVELGRLERGRHGMTAEGFRLYRVVGRGAMAVLPRPEGNHAVAEP